MSVAERLRELAERLPPGVSLTLTREGLLELATVDGGHADQAADHAEFTVVDLAIRFHRSASTVRGWCEHGRFEGAFKLNRRDWRIPEAAVDAFLFEQRRQPRTSPVNLSAWRVIRRTE